ncbi:MAG: response regulator [Planctomycetota bacterium]|jgi:CheY-like chemotaxis protein
MIKEKWLARKILMDTETVLLVDDEDFVIDIAHEILKTLGYKVLLAKGGKEAIEVYQKNQNNIDLVILDMIMPGTGGGEVFDAIRENNPVEKVLLTSGYDVNGQAKTILERGCNGFIQKPFNLKELSMKMREILDKE